MKKVMLSIIAGLLFTLCTKKEQLPALTPPRLLVPADGSTISQNPPLFVWSTINEHQIVYVLEIATDTFFDYASICMSATMVPPDTEFLPDSAFIPGTYFWHACTREDC